MSCEELTKAAISCHQVCSSSAERQATAYSLMLEEDLQRRDAVPSEQTGLTWIYYRFVDSALDNEGFRPLKQIMSDTSNTARPENTD